MESKPHSKGEFFSKSKLARLPKKKQRNKKINLIKKDKKKESITVNISIIFLLLVIKYTLRINLVIIFILKGNFGSSYKKRKIFKIRAETERKSSLFYITENKLNYHQKTQTLLCTLHHSAIT